jgi:hypothetical protein
VLSTSGLGLGVAVKLGVLVIEGVRVGVSVGLGVTFGMAGVMTMMIGSKVGI